MSIAFPRVLRLLAAGLAGLAAGTVVRAVERAAADAAGLAAALAAARPGDTIVLADGTWRDVAISLSAAGEPGRPVVVRARTPGAAIFTGASSLTFAAPHVEASGLQFRGGALPGGAVVAFRSDHCRLVDTAVVDYNPPEVATGYYWVYFDGSHNRVERCLFAGKSHQEPVVGNDRTDSRHNAVVASHFRDIPYVPGRNGREVFRIWGYGGNEELGDDGAFFLVEGNLFERADGEGMEIVSLKSNRNIVRGNTFIRTRGGITNRSGNYNTIVDNVLLCDGQAGAYGLRITGRHHLVARNYVRGGEYGLHLMAGEFIEGDLTGSYRPILREGTPLGRVPAYHQPQETLVADNVLVDNTGVDLLLGNGYKSGWPHAQRVLLPERNRIEGNRVFKPRGGVAVDQARRDAAAPLDRFAFAPNRFAGNRVVGGTVGPGLVPPPEGIAVVAPEGETPPPPPRILTPAEVGPAWLR